MRLHVYGTTGRLEMILTKSVFAAVALSLAAGPPAGRAASDDNLWRSLATKAQDLRIDGRFTESRGASRSHLSTKRSSPVSICGIDGAELPIDSGAASKG